MDASPRPGRSWYAAVRDWSVRRESPRFRDARREVAGGARGRVLELGVGVGSNWPFLAPGIDYLGIEPDPAMLARARRHGAAQKRVVDLLPVPAEELPFDDASFDTVIVTLTRCSVDDLGRALAETRRVLRPDGELRFWEHVRPDGRFWGPITDRITPLWRYLAGGCHPNRRTLEAMERTGFEVRQLRRFGSGPVPMVVGVAAPRR